MKLRTIEDAERALLAFVPPPRSQRQKYTLGPIRAFMEAIGNPQDTYQVVHIAGTSGKTSTCYYTAALLTASGLKTGLTVSPHISKVSERVQINLEPASDELFASELNEFLEVVKNVGIALTYFEVLMAFAYWFFARQKVDVAVIETGIGGLLDGSNVVRKPTKVCVLTDIGLDHTALLGETIPQIAAQKAGIIGEDNEVFCWLQSPPVMSVFKNASKAQRATMHIRKNQEKSLPNTMPLFQKRNFSLAVSAATWVLHEKYHIKLDATSLHQATKQVIPARMEEFTIGKSTVTLDGAHNPQKMQALIESFQHRHGLVPTAVLFACIEGPDAKIEQTVAALLAIKPKKIILTSFQSLQDMKKISINPNVLQEAFKHAGYHGAIIERDPHKALQTLLSDQVNVLVTGSLYLLFEVRNDLLKLTH